MTPFVRPWNPGTRARCSRTPPAFVSFTFGCPSPDVVRAFQDRGTVVIVTVTSADPDGVNLWAGESFRGTTEAPAAETVAALAPR
ncbi:nitronate monooxygenase [Actinomadura madurae]|uniref:nitronate monooxygenase n=1 Tax=Actinomadura madurae TaxID=1993 RepID=UPI002026C0FE|nr:nitronate monooxygenase [Actinomadura madurae]URM98028.1 nitronate monooxygenase [Actinomadura madurae]URN08716.1 nitronate monooxygenase [Actinomadura madurae]